MKHEGVVAAIMRLDPFLFCSRAWER